MTIVRPLTKRDIPDIRYLDQQGEFEILPMVKDILEEDSKQDYIYGIEHNNHVVGYCTVGGTEPLTYDKNIKNIKFSYQDALLSDVFVLPCYRHKKYAQILVNYAIRQHPKRKIYADILYDNLTHLYKSLGFVEVIPNCLMSYSPA